jgi:HSP20 family molecular chaperone IbpA
MYELVNKKRNDFLMEFDEMDSIFGNLFNNIHSAFGDFIGMDDAGNISYEIECPGFNKDNTTVEITDGILTVKGERKSAQGERKLFKRLRVGSQETVDAKIEDGILYLTLKQPEEKKTKIEFK